MSSLDGASLRRPWLGLALLGLLTVVGCERRPQATAPPPPPAAASSQPPVGVPVGKYPPILRTLKLQAARTAPSRDLGTSSETLVVGRNGTAALGRLSGRLRKIGSIAREGVCLMGAEWSPGGKRILMFVDINSSNNWFLWNGQTLRDITKNVHKAIGEGYNCGRVWFSREGGIVTFATDADGGHMGTETAPSSPAGFFSIFPPRRLWTLPGAQGDRIYWPRLSHDKTYLVLSSLGGQGGANRRTWETWDVEGRKLGEVAYHADAEILRWTDTPPGFVLVTQMGQKAAFTKTGEPVRPRQTPAAEALRQGRRFIRAADPGKQGDDGFPSLLPEGIQASRAEPMPDGNALMIFGGKRSDYKHLYFYVYHRDAVVVVDSPCHFREPKGSPDGKWVALRAHQKPGVEALAVVDSAMTQARLLTAWQSAGTKEWWVRILGWSPDSKAVLYHADGAVWAATPDGKARRKLFTIPYACYVSFRGSPPV